MTKYVKSYSNYVLKTKHQETNDGIIYERDITTIGGRDHFSAGQVPLYRSGNFIITINNDDTSHKNHQHKDGKAIYQVTLGHLIYLVNTRRMKNHHMIKK